MAWTWPTAAFFIFIFLCLVGMSVWEYYAPGGAPRRGILGLDTTRGDRLFISLLGSAFIFLAWLGLMGPRCGAASSSRSSSPSRSSAGSDLPNSLSL